MLTSVQVAEKSILDAFNRQTYLGNTYIFGSDISTIGATTETPILLLSNSSTNSQSLFIQLKKLTCFTSNQSAIFKIYYNPTVTSIGTVETPVNLKNGSASTSVSSLSMSPTVSANGIYVGALASANQTPNISELLQVIDPGHSMLITVTLSQINVRFISEIVWYEL